jgi:hypothetical protein
MLAGYKREKRIENRNKRPQKKPLFGKSQTKEKTSTS